MCISVLSFKESSLPIVLVHNRDEYHHRTYQEALLNKKQNVTVAGGIDELGGMWGGVNSKGNFCIVTNLRAPALYHPKLESRGKIVKNFLENDTLPEDYLNWLDEHASRFNHFNLLFGNREHAFYFSSKDRATKKLSPGLYGLSNAALDTPWPKTLRAKNKVSHILQTTKEDKLATQLTQSFLDPHQVHFDSDTGITPEQDYLLSSIFVASENYGTQSTLVILIHQENIQLTETYYEKGVLKHTVQLDLSAK